MAGLDETEQLAWRDKLADEGFGVSPVKDRRYFRSIYFEEPGGILLEIATEAPGFAVDEPLERLGTSLMLPPSLESQRPRIEKRLPMLHRGARAA